MGICGNAEYHPHRYIWLEEYLIPFVNWLVYIVNSKGPRTDPCGTPICGYMSSENYKLQGRNQLISKLIKEFHDLIMVSKTLLKSSKSLVIGTWARLFQIWGKWEATMILLMRCSPKGQNKWTTKDLWLINPIRARRCIFNINQFFSYIICKYLIRYKKTVCHRKNSEV